MQRLEEDGIIIPHCRRTLNAEAAPVFSGGASLGPAKAFKKKNR